MHITIVAVATLVFLVLAVATRRRTRLDDPQRRQQFRRLLYAWSFRAAGLAFVLAILWIIALRAVA